jgi:hypothetical protein
MIADLFLVITSWSYQGLDGYEQPKRLAEFELTA